MFTDSHRTCSAPGVSERVPGTEWDEGEVPAGQPMAMPVDLDEELPRQHVERLLERVEVALEPPARGQRADRQLGVDGALRGPDEDRTGEQMRRRRRRKRGIGEGPIDPRDVMPAASSHVEHRKARCRPARHGAATVQRCWNP